jgi:hypothetical protein
MEHVCCLEGIRLRFLVIICDDSRLWVAFPGELNVNCGAERSELATDEIDD